MMARSILFLFLGIDALVLFYESSLLSISYREANFLYYTNSLLNLIVSASLGLFGQNDFALRLPMIVMHLLSALLLYRLSADYLKRERDRLWLVVIFMLIPGVNSSALLVDNSGFVILLLLLYLTFFSRTPWLNYLFLFLVLWIDVSFAILYLGLFFYAVNRKKTRLLIVTLLFFTLSLYFHDYLPHGRPEGHFLDTLGLYAAIFSPIVFVYLFFVLYRRFVDGRVDRIWYLAATALISSLLLSFRQEIEVEVFAPYLILALPLAAQSFFHSYRVRLKPFRKSYRLLFTISFVFLILNTMVVLFHKELYHLLDNPSKHFAYRQHVAKELAEDLRSKGITCVDAGNKVMQLRLRFYGVNYCRKNILENNAASEHFNVTIGYNGVLIYKNSVTKIHNY